MVQVTRSYQQAKETIKGTLYIILVHVVSFAVASNNWLRFFLLKQATNLQITSNKCKNPSAILIVRSNNEKDSTRC